MADNDDNSVDQNPAARGELVNRIDELERLLEEKKNAAETSAQARMKFGTDGIPVLVDIVDADMIKHAAGTEDSDRTGQQGRLIEDIIDKVDQEISADLDELINLLKDSIIDEVKTRLMKELTPNKDHSDAHD